MTIFSIFVHVVRWRIKILSWGYALKNIKLTNEGIGLTKNKK